MMTGKMKIGSGSRGEVSITQDKSTPQLNLIIRGGGRRGEAPRTSLRGPVMSKDIRTSSRETTLSLRSPCVLPDRPKAHTAKRRKYKCFTNARLQLNIDLHGVSLRLGTPCNHSLPIVIRHHTAFVKNALKAHQSHFRQSVGRIDANYCKPAGCAHRCNAAYVETSVRNLERYELPPGIWRRHQLATSSATLRLCENCSATLRVATCPLVQLCQYTRPRTCEHGMLSSEHGGYRLAEGIKALSDLRRT